MKKTFLSIMLATFFVSTLIAGDTTLNAKKRNAQAKSKHVGQMNFTAVNAAPRAKCGKTWRMS